MLRFQGHEDKSLLLVDVRVSMHAVEATKRGLPRRHRDVVMMITPGPRARS